MNWTKNQLVQKLHKFKLETEGKKAVKRIVLLT